MLLYSVGLVVGTSLGLSLGFHDVTIVGALVIVKIGVDVGLSLGLPVVVIVETLEGPLDTDITIAF